MEDKEFLEATADWSRLRGCVISLKILIYRGAFALDNWKVSKHLTHLIDNNRPLKMGVDT